ncbi:MAG: VOC family protein [Bacteroidota bacterium]
MRPKKLTPMLWTENIDETLRFYSKYLGFHCTDRNDDWGWALLNNGEIELMVTLPNTHKAYDQLQFTGSFYFYIEDVEQLWKWLESRVKIAYPMESFDWGMKEFGIYDNNGYMLQFGQYLDD